MNNDVQRYLFIVNPISGTGTGRDEFAELLAEFSLVHDVKVLETPAQADVISLLEAINASNFESPLLVACGGDGTVGQVFECGLHKALPVGIVPLGSGNGLAHDLGFTTIERAFEALYEPDLQPLDAIEINGNKLCWHICDIGFNAHIVSKYAQDGLRGNLNYALHSLAEYVDFNAGRLEIITHGHDLDHTFFMVAGANSRMFGTNVILSPNAKLNDGKFELCLIRDFSKLEGPGLLLDLVGGNLADSGFVHTVSVSEARIINHSGLPFQIDGEFQGFPNEVVMKAVPSAVWLAIHPDYTPSSLFI